MALGRPRKTSQYKAVNFAERATKLPRSYDVTETPKMRSNMPYERGSKQRTRS